MRHRLISHGAVALVFATLGHAHQRRALIDFRFAGLESRSKDWASLDADELCRRGAAHDTTGSGGRRRGRRGLCRHRLRTGGKRLWTGGDSVPLISCIENAGSSIEMEAIHVCRVQVETEFCILNSRISSGRHG